MTKRVWIKLIALLVLVVIVVILIIQNTPPGNFTIFLWDVRISQSLLLLVTFLLGFVAGIIAILQISAREEGKK